MEPLQCKTNQPYQIAAKEKYKKKMDKSHQRKGNEKKFSKDKSKPDEIKKPVKGGDKTNKKVGKGQKSDVKLSNPNTEPVPYKRKVRFPNLKTR
mgnify:CR=1 FL=1